ncbi:MAG: type II toxin-antitoxin system VapC family toxin [Planctomycetes bacterium]|nr:type II toxin-antitoxin system VapC family toxin [Planctomycetota bacterium]
MILADTSVWVDHLRRGDAALANLLEAGEVFCHPFIVGELACGTLRNRSQILRLLSDLPALPRPTDNEILVFIDRHRLMGRGLGLTDVHLLATCLLAGAKLWTRDGKLAGAAAALGVAPRES